MKLEKAIELLQQDLNDPGSVDYNDRAKAQELGIEAIKALKANRDKAFGAFLGTLPGETRDEKRRPS